MSILVFTIIPIIYFYVIRLTLYTTQNAFCAVGFFLIQVVVSSRSLEMTLALGTICPIIFSSCLMGS